MQIKTTSVDRNGLSYAILENKEETRNDNYIKPPLQLSTLE